MFWNICVPELPVRMGKYTSWTLGISWKSICAATCHGHVLEWPQLRPRLSSLHYMFPRLCRQVRIRIFDLPHTKIATPSRNFHSLFPMDLHETIAEYNARVNPPSLPLPPPKATPRMVNAIRAACAKGKAKFKSTVTKFKAKFKPSGSGPAAATPVIEEGRGSCETWVTESFYSDY